MNDTEKLNWLLKEAGHTRADLDKAINIDKLIDNVVACVKKNKSESD